MKADIERWDKKYSAATQSRSLSPDPLLLKHRALFENQAHSPYLTALDLACGQGHNGVFLARLGYWVVLCDGSAVALKQARELAAAHQLSVEGFVADLDDYPLPAAMFDALIVIRFLQRQLVAHIRQSLRPGGILLYKTFNRNWLQSRPGFPQEYLLNHGELSDWFGDFHCIDSNDHAGNIAHDSYWVGRKPGSQADAIYP